jgi:hypothetical protein
MQTFLNIWLALTVVVIAWGLTMAGIGYVARLSERQHSP